MEYRYRELSENKFHIVVSDTSYCAMHGHDFLEFTYVISGEMEHNVDGNYSTVKKGDYFIVDHGTMHEYKQTSKEQLRVINLLFFPEFVERTLAGYKSFEDVVNSYLLRFSYKSLSDSPTGKAFSDNKGLIQETLNRIMSEYKDKKYGYIEYIRCKLIEILIITMRKISRNEKQVGKSDVIIEITEYIKKHYTEKIKLSDMAKKYNYSLSYISKKFTEETGMNFSDYLQHIRIEQSCRLLENSDLRINEIASKVGYDNVKFFNRVFKDVLKLTPREFKKLHL